ncbi:hypothetical protein CROQUDRAFT_92120 [Cronartium quercuum f. sp. fusiforme G11]|uniref:Uncharacterized protein n=1 Tax=Cronartium quercuum f. sp. fusiforme G11 TaxID=708437 RepID=A0A9P6TDJ5_9BASI|nr:hypothetical protein CROQUDRAFT_92120 [Cronartium quercuum f. sp. fusiforme G11]
MPPDPYRIYITALDVANMDIGYMLAHITTTCLALDHPARQSEATAPTNQGLLPEDTWASKTNLTEVWEHPDEGANTDLSGHLGP